MNHLNSGELVSLLLLDLEQYFVFLFAPVAAAAAKLLQSCLTLCDPTDGSPPGSLSLGFSRQEHWSELPFPSPMHESEKWKGSHSVVSNSSRPHGLLPTRPLHPWDSRQEYWSGVPLLLLGFGYSRAGQWFFMKYFFITKTERGIHSGWSHCPCLWDGAWFPLSMVPIHGRGSRGIRISFQF